jgi:hypothetical protein
VPVSQSFSGYGDPIYKSILLATAIRVAPLNHPAVIIAKQVHTWSTQETEAMPPPPAIHSIDITLDRTDTVLLTDSLKGVLSPSLHLASDSPNSSPPQHLLPPCLW